MDQCGFLWLSQKRLGYFGRFKQFGKKEPFGANGWENGHFPLLSIMVFGSNGVHLDDKQFLG